MNGEPAGGGPVTVLRAATARLREVVRDHPREPWRGGTDRVEQAGEPEPLWPRSHRPWPDRPRPERAVADPSASFADLVRGHATGGPLEPGQAAGGPLLPPPVAEPLADLLEALADRAAVQDDPQAEVEPLHSALRVAAAVLR